MISVVWLKQFHVLRKRRLKKIYYKKNEIQKVVKKKPRKKHTRWAFGRPMREENKLTAGLSYKI